MVALTRTACHSLPLTIRGAPSIAPYWPVLAVTTVCELTLGLTCSRVLETKITLSPVTNFGPGPGVRRRRVRGGVEPVRHLGADVAHIAVEDIARARGLIRVAVAANRRQ